MKIMGSPNGRVRLRNGDLEYSAWFDDEGYAEVSSDVAMYLIANCPGISAADEEGAVTVVEEVAELHEVDEADEPEEEVYEDEEEDVVEDVVEDDTYTEEGE